MYTLIAAVATLLILMGISILYVSFKPRLQFFVEGMNAGFNYTDIRLLWDVAKICDLDNPIALFYSLPVFIKCMTQITTQAEADGTYKTAKMQTLITKLFNFRTKIQNEADSKKGMSSTGSIANGQKLRIVLPGKGVFVSEVLNNGKQIYISIPERKGQVVFSASEWVKKIIHVYFWRKGDARYVFDTTVTGASMFLGKPVLLLKHSTNLVRTQKRKSIRAPCSIYADLFIITRKIVDYSSVETKNAFRCLIEDISESGALIKIGGKGKENVQIKIQFTIQSKLIIMFGVVKTVEFNADENQSLLHFECTHIEPTMKNEILKYVYNIIPESEKEIMEALAQTEDDKAQDEVYNLREHQEIAKAIESAAMELIEANQVAAYNELKKTEPEQNLETINTSGNNSDSEKLNPDLPIDDFEIKFFD